MKQRQGKPIKCNICGFEISSFFFKQHQKTCDGIGPKWATQNQRYKRKTPVGQKQFSPGGWNKGLDKTDPRVQAFTDANRKNGTYDRLGAACRKRWASGWRPKGIENLGGYREHGGRSKGDHRTDSFGKKVWLQSSYEICLQELLDELEIRWIRPRALLYELNGKKKRYFPDFFLVDSNLYLDPKNDFLAIKDAEKIQVVEIQNAVKVVVLLKPQITKEFLISLISSRRTLCDVEKMEVRPEWRACNP